MNRELEPEVMDGDDQSIAYARADFDEVNEAFVDRIATTFPNLIDGHFVDLGCGPADIPIRFCTRFPAIQITAVDASGPMITLAHQAVMEANLSTRITPIEGYLPGALKGTFDGAISNSLLHHLPEPSVLWTTLRDHVRPGAPVYVMDLMRPGDKSQAQAIVDTYSPNEPEVLRQDFFYSLCAAFTPSEVREQLTQAGLSSLQLDILSDRHIGVWGHMP
jgi:trans-aconitate methyltransferase